jgi:hypothetical protein
MKPARRKFFPIPFLIAVLAACAGPVSHMPKEVVAKIPLVEAAAESAEFFRTVLMQLNPSTAGKIAHDNARRMLAKRKIK